MTDDFSDITLLENQDPRCAVVLVLDTSDSMGETLPGQSKSALDELNGGLDILVSELYKDPLARRRVELSIVTYGTEVSPATPFATIENCILPTLVTSGVTSTGKAVETALNAIEERKKEYKSNGLEYYKSWIILISDGRPTDDIATAAQRIKKAEDRGSLAFFAIGVEGADLGKLQELSVRPPLALSGMKFPELFLWLSASTSAVSASTPGDGVPLPSPSGWAEL